MIGDNELDDLRARVERRRRGRESAELRLELQGRNIPVEEGVVYMSVKELTRLSGLTSCSVTEYIRSGSLPARKTVRGNGKGLQWAIHPKDAKRFLETYGKVIPTNG